MATSTIKVTPTETINLTTSSLSHLANATAVIKRKGNIGVLTINATNTSADLAVGNDASFSISGMPALLNGNINCTGYSGNTAIICNISNTTVTMRITGASWYRTYGFVVNTVVVFE